MKRFTHIGPHVRRTASLIGRVARTQSIPTAFVALIILLLVSFGFAETSISAGPVAQTEATATPAGSPSVPSPVVSAPVPAAQNTAASTVDLAPPPEETQLAQAAEATQAASGPTSTAAAGSTPETSLLPSDAPGGPSPGTSGTAPGDTAGSTGSTDFPWLPVILLGAALLGGLLYLMSRRRTPEAVAVAPAPRGGTAIGAAPYQTSAGPAAPASSTTAELSSPPSIAAATTAAVAAPAPFVPPAVLPDTLDCPNCGLTNGFNENFCPDCGQDLRPTRAALIEASTPPPDLVTETTPYLETVSRVDEQLEYVLSRPRVVIGTAAGSDIVIDSLFQGWQTVDPTHAELRRDSEGFMLVDLGSGSGTFVNEMRTGENMLSNGDIIRVGDVQFVFRVPA